MRLMPLVRGVDKVKFAYVSMCAVKFALLLYSAVMLCNGCQEFKTFIINEKNNKTKTYPLKKTFSTSKRNLISIQ